MQVLAEKRPRETLFLLCENSQNILTTRNSGEIHLFSVSGAYGARYLDPRTSRWISVDPAVGDYIPQAPTNDDARKRNGNLPGMGGVYNLVNLHVYHYAGNNPVKYTDPDGRMPASTYDLFLSATDSYDVPFSGGGGGVSPSLIIGAGLAVGAAVAVKSINPFPENRHIPPGNRPQSPMGKKANGGPMELPEGPNLDGPSPKGKFKAFIAVALVALARIWDNLTESSSSPPHESPEKQSEGNGQPSINDIPLYYETPSFVPAHSKPEAMEKSEIPPPLPLTTSE